jgi:outer membrane protein W
MKTIGIAVTALVGAAATSAFAQSSAPPTPSEAALDAEDVLTAPVRAPDKALELGVSAGYTQGFGSITPDRRVSAGPGGAIGASVGYRINPHWSVGATGQYQGYGASGASASAATLRGATVDVHGTYHLSPYSRLDPYVNLGSGYRLFAESPAGNAPTTLTHSLELGKIAVGLDVRSTESVAISPVVGLDLNLFILRAGGAPAPAAATGNQSVSAFVFAGVEGRFDLGGARLNKPAP